MDTNCLAEIALVIASLNKCDVGWFPSGTEQLHPIRLSLANKLLSEYAIKSKN
jgi:hypothetical protein